MKSKGAKFAIQIVFSNKYWFRYPRTFLLAMSPLESLVMAWLLNEEYLADEKGELSGSGFFMANSQKMSADFYQTDRKKQWRVLRSLKDKGFVSFFKKGRTGKLIKIEKKNLLKTLAKKEKIFLKAMGSKSGTY